MGLAKGKGARHRRRFDWLPGHGGQRSPGARRQGRCTGGGSAQAERTRDRLRHAFKGPSAVRSAANGGLPLFLTAQVPAPPRAGRVSASAKGLPWTLESIDFYATGAPPIAGLFRVSACLRGAFIPDSRRCSVVFMDQPAKSIDADDCAVTLIPGDSRLRRFEREATVRAFLRCSGAGTLRGPSVHGAPRRSAGGPSTPAARSSRSARQRRSPSGSGWVCG
jgi:hypothetical protein